MPLPRTARWSHAGRVDWTCASAHGALTTERLSGGAHSARGPTVRALEPQDPIWLRITRPHSCALQVSPPSSPRDKPHGWFRHHVTGGRAPPIADVVRRGAPASRVDHTADAQPNDPARRRCVDPKAHGRGPTTLPSGAVLSSFGRQQWAGGGFCECWVRAQLAQRDRASGLLRVQPELAQQLGKLSFRESQLRPKSPHEDGLEVGNCEHGGLVVHSLVG